MVEGYRELGGGIKCPRVFSKSEDGTIEERDGQTEHENLWPDADFDTR